MKKQIVYLRKELNTKKGMKKTTTINFDKDNNKESETEKVNDLDERIITKEHVTSFSNYSTN